MALPAEPESDERNFVTYVNRSLEDEEEFHFLRLEFLQRLNIVNHQVKLVRLKSDFQRNGRASQTQLDSLSVTMREYASAIRDYEFLRQHDGLDKTSTRDRKLLLQRFFQSESDFNDPFQSHYSAFRDNHHKLDPLRRFFMRHLPVQLSFSSHERRERKKEYTEGRLPKEVSTLVDRLVRFVIALTGGAFVVIPMIVMSINQSQTKSLITVSACVIIFALVASLGVRVSNVETLVATATYAAVLVVFVGTSNAGNS